MRFTVHMPFWALLLLAPLLPMYVAVKLILWLARRIVRAAR